MDPHLPPSHHRKTSSPFSSGSSSSSSFSATSSLSGCSSSPDLPAFPSSGVPFSWERQPGVRSKSSSSHAFLQNQRDPRIILLPLPPAALCNPSFEFRKPRSGCNGRDPFAAALANCSSSGLRRKAGGSLWKAMNAHTAVNGVAGLLDRHVSCRMSCSVVESKVHIPKSSRPRSG